MEVLSKTLDVGLLVCLIMIEFLIVRWQPRGGWDICDNVMWK